MMRSATDLLRLIWSIRRGYTLLLPYVLDRAWPALRLLALAHRRTLARRVRIVAVVGSLGKTTTKRMVEAALGKGLTRHSVSNHGAGLALNLLASRPGHRAAVLEVGIDRPGRMASFARLIRPDIAVVTSVKSDHNRSLHTLEATRAEKAQMVRALPARGLAVLNGDDPHVRWMATQTNARVVWFGLQESNDVYATDVALEWPRGIRFVLHAAGEARPVRIRLLGAHQVYAALAAVAVGLAQGRPLPDLIRRLEGVEPTPMRLQPIPLANGTVLVSDELKASAESVSAALETFAGVSAARRIVVLGDIDEPPGDARAVYRELGRQLARAADDVVLVGSHWLKTLRAEAVRSGIPRQSIRYVGGSVHDAIDAVRADMRDGDAILLKGSYSQRLHRITLALQGHPVRCCARQCKVRVASCRTCPLLEQPERVFENTYIRRLVKLRLGTA